MDLLPMNNALMNQILGISTTPPSVTIRAARPDDVEPIMEMHQRLSGDTLYQRYHINRLPSRKEIEQIIQVDGENGRVLVAAVPGQTSKIVGLAFYVITEQGTAETAFLVEDLYQGQGLGRRLMQALTRAAASENICQFSARVLTSNKPMIHLLKTSGQLIDKRIDYGAYELKIDICPVSE